MDILTVVEIKKPVLHWSDEQFENWENSDEYNDLGGVYYDEVFFDEALKDAIVDWAYEFKKEKPDQTWPQKELEDVRQVAGCDLYFPIAITSAHYFFKCFKKYLAWKEDCLMSDPEYRKEYDRGCHDAGWDQEPLKKRSEAYVRGYNQGQRVRRFGV